MYPVRSSFHSISDCINDVDHLKKLLEYCYPTSDKKKLKSQYEKVRQIGFELNSWPSLNMKSIQSSQDPWSPDNLPFIVVAVLTGCIELVNTISRRHSDDKFGKLLTFPNGNNNESRYMTLLEIALIPECSYEYMRFPDPLEKKIEYSCTIRYKMIEILVRETSFEQLNPLYSAIHQENKEFGRMLFGLFIPHVPIIQILDDSSILKLWSEIGYNDFVDIMYSPLKATDTPLMWAAGQMMLNTIKFLVSCGIGRHQLDICDEITGISTRDLSKLHGSEELHAAIIEGEIIAQQRISLYNLHLHMVPPVLTDIITNYLPLLMSCAEH